MKNTLIIVGKEPKFAPIHISITNKNLDTEFPMNRSTTFWRLATRLIVVFLSLQTTFAEAKNTTLPRTSVKNLANIGLFASFKTASIGDIVNIEVTTQGFTDVDALTIPIGWNPALLSYQSASNLTGLLDGFNQTTSFQTANASTGFLLINWEGLPSSIDDGEPFFTLTFRVLAYSPTPASVSFNDLLNGDPLSIFTSGGVRATVTRNHGKVTILKPNSCPVRPAGLTCQTAPLLNSTEFPYYGRLPITNTLTIPTKGIICLGGNIDNNHWLAFIAASTELTFKVLPSNFSADGIQFFVYSTADCDTFYKVEGGCFGRANFSAINAALTGLVIGQTYYMMIDGYTGDVCSYEISVASGQIYNATQAIPTPTITGLSQICGSRTNLTYSIPTVPNAENYLWRANAATPTTPLSGANQKSITVNWGNVSDSVCVRIVAKCDTTAWFCKSVKVGTPNARTIDTTKCTAIPYFFKGQNRTAAGTYIDTLTNASGCDSVVTLILRNFPPITRDSALFKCAQDGITWGGSVRRAAGDYPATFQTAAGCDSTVTLILRNYPTATKSIDTTICAGTSVVIGGQTRNTQGNFAITVPRGSSRGCDSIINLKLTLIDFTLPIPTKNNEITCEFPQSTLTAGVVNKPTAATVAYEWKNSSGVVIGTTPSVSVNQAGVFTVTATVTLNGRNCPKSNSVTVTKSGNQPTKPTIAGPNTTCGALNEAYLIPTPLLNDTSYKWTVTNGTFTRGVNQITTTWNANATNSKVCVGAQNACGVSDTACISVDIGQIPGPLSITGSTTVCPNATITYRVSPMPNTTLRWSVTGGTAQNALTTDSLWVRWAATNGRVTVTPSSRCGTGLPTILDVQISNTIPDSLPIQGIASPCSNDTTVFTVADAASTTDYDWQVPTGASILRGQGTRTIIVFWGTFSGNGTVFLTTKNACQLARGVSLPVVIKNATALAPTINGSRTVCPSTQISFSTPRDANIRTYAWTVPADVVLLRGQGTDSIRIDWTSSTSGQVCLDIENACGARQKTCINVTVSADLDSLIITGATVICKDSTIRFCVPDDGSARFVWQVPTTAAIISGQGTSCLTARFSSTGGTVRLLPIGGCSDGKVSRRDVVVKSPPTIVGTISGKNTVCSNSIETYSVPIQADVLRYIWNLPTGVRFVGDSTGNTITVNVTNAAANGFLIVRAENDCGVGNGATIRLSVLARPIVNAGADTTVCGKTMTLNGSSNGSVKTWSIVAKPTGTTANFTAFDRSQTNVTVSKSGIYTFRFEETNGGECNMSDSIDVTFRDVPTVTLIDQNCNQEATDYRVQLSISGNAAPYSIGGSALGSLQNVTFLSNTIPSGTPYFFVVTDNVGCKSDTVKGVKQCPCYTSAGTLRADSLVVCYGLTGKALPLGDAKLDANDISEYVLHTGTATRVGNIFLRNKTGIFAFDSAFLLYNRVYFVTFIVGDQQVSGNVDTSKRCVAQSRGIPIVFKDKFTAGLVGDTTVCRFAPVALRFTTNQTSALDLTYQAGNNPTLSFALNLRNNDPLSINPSLSATYKLIEAKDKNGCRALITDSARINLRTFPISNAGIDRSVCATQVQLEGNENLSYVGKWTSLTAGVQITDPAEARTVINNLQNGRNVFIWTVNDTACLDYSVRDTVLIFLPLLPKAINLSLITQVGKPVNGNVSESAPLGTYSVTRLTNPSSGRFDLFSNGSFTYIPDATFQGIVTFKYIICSDLCTKLCDTGEVRILIQPKLDSVKTIVIDVPNAITPNDDGKNDALVIDGLEQFDKNELVIFNRWGDILYQSKPYKNTWRGTNQSGDPLPEGTYYYVLRLNTADGKILRGDMTILR